MSVWYWCVQLGSTTGSPADVVKLATWRVQAKQLPDFTITVQNIYPAAAAATQELPAAWYDRQKRLLLGTNHLLTCTYVNQLPTDVAAGT